ncbi:MAG: hypothetical protein C0524_12515 [Rhodobacter sp.]|nr:hypothetical protein [Rhodobacter sp.]
MAQIGLGKPAIKSALFALDPRSRKLLTMRRSAKAGEVSVHKPMPDPVGEAMSALPDQTGE